jgi:dihydrofolate reductase
MKKARVDQRLRSESERNDDVVASLAITLDGYISRLDGAVDYLDKYPLEEFNFSAWSERVGALVMGRTTYSQTVEWGWTWGERPTLVLTTATDLPVPEGGNVTFKAAPTPVAIAEFSQETDKRLWVFGGGNVVTAALLGGVVDTLDVTVVPEASGDGIPLFTEPFSGSMRLIESASFDSGAVRLVYDIGETPGVS